MLDSMIALFGNFDLAAFLPQINTVVGRLELAARITVMIGPLTMLGLGLWYFLAPPKAAEHPVSFPMPWGKSSIGPWRYSQWLAGICFTGLGFLLTVIMALICNGYRNMEMMDMAWSAVCCLLWQVGLVAACYLGIFIAVIVRFRRDGSLRKNISP